MFVRSLSYTGILVNPVFMIKDIVSKSRTDWYSIMKASSSFVITDPTVFFDSSKAPAIMFTYNDRFQIWLNYTVSQKNWATFFTAYNFRNIEQIFAKLGTNHVLFMLNIMP